jgi:sec-independent protein translocase protein TatB
VFNIGPGELAVILIAALIVLGPKRLPELARTIGKFMREFRRQTDDVRNLVEREFYKMDKELQEMKPALEASKPHVVPPVAAIIDPGHDAEGRLLPVTTEPAPSKAAPSPATPEPSSSADPKTGTE